MTQHNTIDSGLPMSQTDDAPRQHAPGERAHTQWGSGFKRTLLIAGALCSFLIGAGFATGQEALQYFTAHGWWGIAAIGLVILLFGWVMTSMTEWGRHHQDDQADPFLDICGKYIGTVLKVLVPVFIFAVAVTMVAGAGALLHDVVGLPVWAGSSLMAAVLGATLLLGFRRLVEILGRVGPIIIGFVALVSTWVLVREFDALGSANDMLAEYQPPKAMENLFISTVLYCTSVMVMSVPFLASLGKTVGGQKTTAKGGFLAATGFGVVMMLTSLGLMAALPVVHDKAAPLVLLGAQILPLVGYAFSVVTFLGIFTTAAPMLWIIADQLPTPTPTIYRWVVLGLTLAALVGGLVFPFGALVGAIYPFIGLFGLVFCLCLMVWQVRRRLSTKATAS